MGVTDVDIRPILTRIVLMFFVILTGFFYGQKLQMPKSSKYYLISNRPISVAQLFRGVYENSGFLCCISAKSFVYSVGNFEQRLSDISGTNIIGRVYFKWF